MNYILSKIDPAQKSRFTKRDSWRQAKESNKQALIPDTH